MEYEYNIGTLLEGVKEEVSRVAGAAYAEDGTPLYDAVIITSAEYPTIERYLRDAKGALALRTADICFPDEDMLLFNVPDFGEQFAEVVAQEIDRYFILGACSSWFQQRLPAKAEEYAARSQAAADKAVGLLKTIQAPTRA